MNDYLKQTLHIYERNKINFHSVLDWHLCHGIVVSCFDGFALGFYVSSEDPTIAVEMCHSDSLFVTMCCGNMHKCLEPFKDDFEYIIFQREFKNSPKLRGFSMKKFFNKLKK